MFYKKSSKNSFHLLKRIKSIDDAKIEAKKLKKKKIYQKGLYLNSPENQGDISQFSPSNKREIFQKRLQQVSTETIIKSL